MTRKDAIIYAQIAVYNIHKHKISEVTTENIALYMKNAFDALPTTELAEDYAKAIEIIKE